MSESNSLLLILQASSFTITFSLAVMLLFAKFHQPDTSKEYEQMRWCNIAALLLMAIHYILQMAFGFRAQGADVGALINTLFYSPVIYIFSYSILRFGSRKAFQRRHSFVAAACLLLIFSCFIGGLFYYDSLHMPIMLHTMGFIFSASIAYCYLYSVKEIRRMQKLVDEESGQTQVQYNLFLHTGSSLIYITSLLMSISIYFNPVVLIVGPLMLIAMLFYIVSFIALGFNIGNVSQIIRTEIETEVTESGSETTVEEGKTMLADEQKENIGHLIADWRQQKGFATSELNSSTLASRLGIAKRLLVQYLREVEGKTFRVWLSDLRLEEAKQLIIEHPDYSNESIAEACGFSRSHLQVKFKESTGLTTNDWREAHINC